MTYLVRGFADKSHNLLNLSSITSFRGNDLPGQEIGDQSQNLLNLSTNPLKDSDLPGQGTCGSEPESAQPSENPLKGQ